MTDDKKFHKDNLERIAERLGAKLGAVHVPPGNWLYTVEIPKIHVIAGAHRGMTAEQVFIFLQGIRAGLRLAHQGGA